MPRRSLTLRQAVRVLRRHHGAPEPPPSADPFELVLWENVAYLGRSRETARSVRETPEHDRHEPEAHPLRQVEGPGRVTAHGILKGTFAAKLRECARIATDAFDGDLGAALRAAPAEARRALRSFPGVGEPGADKILLFAGYEPSLAPESNGLRVLVRLGPVSRGRFVRPDLCRGSRRGGGRLGRPSLLAGGASAAPEARSEPVQAPRPSLHGVPARARMRLCARKVGPSPAMAEFQGRRDGPG